MRYKYSPFYITLIPVADKFFHDRNVCTNRVSIARTLPISGKDTTNNIHLKQKTVQPRKVY